jgi:hypothetical protein
LYWVLAALCLDSLKECKRGEEEEDVEKCGQAHEEAALVSPSHFEAV